VRAAGCVGAGCCCGAGQSAAAGPHAVQQAVAVDQLVFERTRHMQRHQAGHDQARLPCQGLSASASALSTGTKSGRAARRTRTIGNPAAEL